MEILLSLLKLKRYLFLKGQIAVIMNLTMMRFRKMGLILLAAIKSFYIKPTESILFLPLMVLLHSLKTFFSFVKGVFILLTFYHKMSYAPRAGFFIFQKAEYSPCCNRQLPTPPPFFLRD